MQVHAPAAQSPSSASFLAKLGGIGEDPALFLPPRHKKMQVGRKGSMPY